MTNSDVKQRIASLQGLPVLPHLAREILLVLDAGTVHWEELAAIAAFDEDMAIALRAASVRERGAASSNVLEVHMVALGLPRVSELVFRHITPGLFDAPRSHGIDLDAFWAHSFSVARYAREIARKIGSKYAHLAYVAGLLHDIGKPALDRVVQGGYSRALELVRQQGLYALEAERRELGADHTVAGKWLAESWGLPGTLITSIWLHHHPAGTLDNTPYPVELIEIVAMANFLAHGDELEASPQERVAAMDEQRWMRLGMERVDVVEMLRGASEEKASTPERIAAPERQDNQAEIREDTARLRQERDFYAALCALHEGMQPGLSPVDQLRLLIASLRGAFAIPAGLCYLTEEKSGAPIVLRWHNLTEEPQVVPLKGTGSMSASLDDLIAALRNASGTGASADASAVHRHGFMALPLLDNNKSVGQLIFQAGQGGPVLTESFLNSLMRFMRAAGASLARCRAVRGAYEEAESLAAAVWKQELSHRNDRRTERLISVGKMAAGAAHEINNPLAVISGKAQLLLANAERAEDRKALETIVEHSLRASGILRDLLQFARPNPPQLLPCRISALLRASVDKVRQRFEEEGIQLIEDYAQDLPLVQVDRLQMEQVFQNILRNAEQSMARQGDKLTIRVRPNQDRTAVIIQIIDTGQGIAADVMDKVFEPFFTTHSGNEGTGMGLAVCHGIVEVHRGTITLHSQEGAGTTCTLTLPVSTAKAAVEAPASTAPAAPKVSVAGGAATRPAARPDEAAHLRQPAKPPAARSEASSRSEAPPAAREAMAPEVAAALRSRGEERPATAPPRPPLENKGSLLLVDQDADLRDVLAEALRGRGYRVKTASDGLEALAEVIANPIDLVMLDGAVPAANAPAGAEGEYGGQAGGIRSGGASMQPTLVDEIQRRKPDLPVILLLGASVPHDAEPGIGAGARQILRKPFDFSQLFATIEQSIAARHVA